MSDIADSVDSLDSSVFGLKEKINDFGVEIYKLSEVLHLINNNLERIATSLEMRECE